MPSSFRLDTLASPVTWLSTELNSLANSARAVSSTLTNTNQELFAQVELTVTFGTAPAAGTTCELYILPSNDGTNFPDDAVADIQAALWVGNFVLRNATAQRRLLWPVLLPPNTFRVVLINRAGVSFPASGSVVRAAYYSTRGT
jgi:hypothetical protein